MNSEKRAEIKTAYKMTHRQIGVYQIKNTENGKIFIGSSLNLQGRLNRHKFELTLGSDQNKKMQKDCQKYGIDKFSFDILECLDPSDDMNHDYTDDLAALEALWLEKLNPYDENGYN
ncbi:MAG: GIY-YIG nuclease family protein [Candidatus Latescibacteria bacterium]|nr:GIY-YIG nuclease family protein [Candidatus Latescibacterota bacterium]